MFRPGEPEAPVSLVAKQKRVVPTRELFAVAVVRGEVGTSCTAMTASLAEASVLAQECFWRTTAEGAYQ